MTDGRQTGDRREADGRQAGKRNTERPLPPAEDPLLDVSNSSVLQQTFRFPTDVLLGLTTLSDLSFSQPKALGNLRSSPPQVLQFPQPPQLLDPMFPAFALSKEMFTALDHVFITPLT